MTTSQQCQLVHMFCRYRNGHPNEILTEEGSLVCWCPLWVSRWPVPGVRLSVDLLLSGQAEHRRPPVITRPSRRADMWPRALPIIIMENKFQIKSELCKYRDNFLHHRGPSWPRWLLASVGVILVSAVIVCVLTLVWTNKSEPLVRAVSSSW